MRLIRKISVVLIAMLIYMAVSAMASEITVTTSDVGVFDVMLPENTDGDLIAALYNKNILQDIKISKARQNQTVTFNISDDIKDGTVRFFLWDGVKTMKPLAQSKRLNVEIPKSKITLDYNTYSLYVGNSSITDFSKWDGYGSYFTLIAAVNSEDYTEDDITWTIDSEDIAYIKSTNKNIIEIRGRRTGVAKATAYLPDGASACCYITVIDNASRLTTERIELNTDTLNLEKGQMAELKPIFYPKDIYNIGILNKTLSWQSSDTAVALVDNSGKVTAVGNGAATITATSADVGRTAECKVIVKDGVIQDEIGADSVITDMTVGEQITLTADTDSEVVWKSDNSYIVDVDKNGVVTAYSNSNIQNVSANGLTVTENSGIVKVYATAVNGGKAAEYQIRVAESDIADEYLKPSDNIIGKSTYTATKATNSISITATDIDIDEVYKIIPDTDGNSKLIWLCSDQSKATIDREGNVKGYASGTVKIYAVSKDSLTAEQIAKAEELQEKRKFTDDEISVVLSDAVSDTCELTVKDSSPYLRNLHIPNEAVMDNSINLLWNRASLIDIPDFKEYHIYINGEMADTTEKLGYTAKNLKSDTNYDFEVIAVDESGNELIKKSVSQTTKSAPAAVLNVLDYGAKGNGKVIDTYAIQSAINACPENGVVYLPRGYVFYSGALFLKSDMTFKVDGILLGSIDPKDYPRWVTKWEGWRKFEQTASEWDNTTDTLPENHMPHASLINAGKYDEGVWGMTGPYNLENLVICGSGQINANGFALAFNEGPNGTYSSEPWTSYDYPVKDPTIRGRAITIQNAKNVYIKDVAVAYSPSWTVHAINCDSITFDDMDVISQGNGNVGRGTAIKTCGHIPNGDGIDPESCTNVNMFNVNFSTGDDAVAMKSGRNREGNEYDKPNAYVRITDCTSKWSLGGFGTGSENASGAHDLLFQNLNCENVRFYGIWLKTTEARGGVTENVVIRDMYVTGANSITCMNHTYPSSETNSANEKPVLRYITMENVNGGKNSNGYQFTGLSGSYISDVTMRGCNISTETGSSIKYGKDFYIKDVEGTVWSQPNCSNITIYRTKVESDTKIASADTRIIKEIDNKQNIVTVYNGATGINLLDSIVSAEGGQQTYELSNREMLTGDEILTVTAPDGEHTSEYRVVVDSEKMDMSYLIAETFSGVADSWGFTGSGGASVTDGVMKLLTSKKTGDSVSKTVDNDIAGKNKVSIKFDWKSNAQSGKGNGSWFALHDRDNNMIFAIYGNGKYVGIGASTTNTGNGWETIEGFSNDWYRVELTLDFTEQTINGNITNITDNKIVKTYINEPMANTAKNLGIFYAEDGYSDAVISLDNIFVKEVD